MRPSDSSIVIRVGSIRASMIILGSLLAACGLGILMCVWGGMGTPVPVTFVLQASTLFGASIVLFLAGSCLLLLAIFFSCKKGRPDGTFLNRELSTFRLLTPVLIRGRVESQIYIPMKFDVTHTLEYLEQLERRLTEKNGRPVKVTVFMLYLTAIIRTIALRPQLNRFVAGPDETWFYQRNNLSFSFVAKKQMTDHAKETNVKVFFSPYETIFTVIDKLSNSVKEAKSAEGNASEKEMNAFSRLPIGLLKLATSLFRWLDKHNVCDKGMIERDVLYTTAFVTNMGSMAGIGAQFCSPFHHLFTWGNASMFMGIGTHEPVWTKNAATGAFEERVIQQFILTYDDRVSEGLYGAKAINILRDLIEHPEQLETHPDIPEDVLEELKLKPEYTARPTTSLVH